MPNGEIRIQNLKMLFERAKQYESASFKGLFNFINFIDKIKFNSEDFNSAKLISENENVVRIMTIHKSKGLEFPVVIIGGYGKQFNFKDLNEPILLDQDLGLGVQYINEKMKIEFPTLTKKALAIKSKDEAISEEMRILYVALTRAKEKLIIVGRQKQANKKMQEKMKLLEVYKNDKKINPYLIGKYKTYLDWLELIYLKEGVEKTKDIFSLDIVNKNEIEAKNAEESEEKNIFEKFKSLADSKNEEEIKKIINWQYKFKNVEDLPTKTSVTKIKEAQNLLNIEEQTRKNKTEENKKVELNEMPNFLKEDVSKISNAQKGTLMHLCVQKMNEKQEYNYEKIEEMLQELVNKNLITQEEKSVINIKKLIEYTKSNLWKELSKASKICKEQPFYITTKASSLYENVDEGADENILVQGVIDLYYINQNGEISLVDYKTDFVKDEEDLVKKYKVQLEVYKKALEQALNMKVSKVEIFSLYLNKEIIL